MMVRPRVMVSSVVEGFEEVRAAARRGIEAGGGEPVLVNEDFPALNVSPRNVCVDAVDSCDALLVVLGERAGYTAPSGKPVVEEEFERAVKRGLHVIVLLEANVVQEPEAERLQKRLSDFVGGRFRTTFSDVGELQEIAAAAVREAVEHLVKPDMDLDSIRDRLKKRSRDRQEPVVRTVFAPLRDEEVVDPLELGRRDFWERLIAMGTAGEVGLFSSWEAKDADLSRDVLTITEEGRRSSSRRLVRLDLEPSGILTLEGNVTGRGETAGTLGIAGLQILVRDVAEVLNEQFAFAAGLFELVDPYQRHQSISYNVALVGAGHRPLVEEASTSGSISMRMAGDRPVVAHPKPRQIGRNVLSSPQAEIGRTLEFLRRRMGES